MIFCLLKLINYSDVEKRPVVFLDLSVDEKPVGTVFIELFNETVPITAENFRLLATGHIPLIIDISFSTYNRTFFGVFTNTHNFYCLPCVGELGFGYKGSSFHRIIPGFVMQGGDFSSNGRGDGQMSVYGPKFGDENFLVKHDSLGSIENVHLYFDKNIEPTYITWHYNHILQFSEINSLY